MKNLNMACPNNPDEICPHRKAIIENYSYDEEIRDGEESRDISDALRLRDATLRGPLLAENTGLAQVLSCGGPTEADGLVTCPINESVRENKVRKGIGKIVRSLVRK